MKGYLVTVTFKDGSKEGVFFTEKADAETALQCDSSGATLAVDFGELYGDEDLPLELTEIAI